MNPENKQKYPPFFLRVTATPNCNLRCDYCNPEGIFTPGTMSDFEMIESIKAAKNNGIDMIHWTGGEPTIRKGMVGLVAAARDAGISYQAITTNGVRFNKLAEEFKDAGLTGASISLDSLNREKVKKITHRDVLEPVYNSIVKSCDLFDEVVVNMVVMPENFDEIPDFIQFANDMGGRFIPRFCELQNYGPSYEENPELFDQTFISREKILARLQELGDFDFVARTEVDQQNAHAEYYTLRDNGLRVGIIAPYSSGWPCSGAECGRVRIGPTGTVKSCVFTQGYQLDGTSPTEKDEIMAKLLLEKKTRIDTNKFPKTHKPAYKELRFGMKKNEDQK